MALVRVLEPEVMETDDEARVYDAMDHAAVNESFVADLIAADATAADLACTLDVGTGTSLIPIELCKRRPSARVIAVDMAGAMLDLARLNVERAALSGVIEVRVADAKALSFATGTFGCVVSNSLLHHIPEPRLALAEMLRVLRPTGLLFVRDLVRPPDEASIVELLARHAAGASPLERTLFEGSLRAALSLEELRAVLADLGVNGASVSVTSDRHVTLVYRSPGA
jgi:ubiquinone/menaquinone biosynthesis C-methylase UbiE